MPKRKYSQVEIDEAKAMLQKYLPCDDNNPPRIYAVIRSVSASGMSRRIDFYTIVSDNPDDSTYRPPRLQYLTGYMAIALDYLLDRSKSGIKVDGCGMDMAFSVVYDLSSVLYSDGYSIKKEDI